MYLFIRFQDSQLCWGIHFSHYWLACFEPFQTHRYVGKRSDSRAEGVICDKYTDERLIDINQSLIKIMKSILFIRNIFIKWKKILIHSQSLKKIVKFFVLFVIIESVKKYSEKSSPLIALLTNHYLMLTVCQNFLD